MLNQVTVMGRLTANPEIRHTQSGLAVATFRLAVDRDYKDKETGQRGVDFIPVVCWRSTAEFVSRFFSKGQMAVASGRLQVRDYTDKDGNKRYATEVIAENVYFADSKRESAPRQIQQEAQDEPMQEDVLSTRYSTSSISDEDDLPF